MKKEQFLALLRKRLKGLPSREVEERINFYSETIYDRIEEGYTEEEAVRAAGNIDSIAEQIRGELSAETAGVKRDAKPWKTVLLILGSPIWFSLLISAFAVVFSLYVSLWAVIISLWAVVFSLAISGVAVTVYGAGFALLADPLAGGALIGAGLVALGLSIFFYVATRVATRHSASLFKILWRALIWLLKGGAV